MYYRIPKQYYEYYCECGKKVKYSSPKQMNYVLASHKTSEKHRKFVGWPLNVDLDPLRDYELPITELLDNEKLESELREILQ